MGYVFSKKPKILIARSLYREEVIGMLAAGARAVLEDAGAEIEEAGVHGSLELPAAVALDSTRSPRLFDAYVVLGCIIKGETIHDEVIAYCAFEALQRLATEHRMAIGNGILTVNTLEQAMERADPKRQNRGAEAARAALDMLSLQQRFSSGLKAA